MLGNPAQSEVTYSIQLTAIWPSANERRTVRRGVRLADRCGLTVTAGEALPSRRLAHLKKQKRNWPGDRENRHIDPGTPKTGN